MLKGLAETTQHRAQGRLRWHFPVPNTRSLLDFSYKTAELTISLYSQNTFKQQQISLCLDVCTQTTFSSFK